MLVKVNTNTGFIKLLIGVASAYKSPLKMYENMRITNWKWHLGGLDDNKSISRVKFKKKRPMRNIKTVAGLVTAVRPIS